MYYLGGKARLGARIASVLQDAIDASPASAWYVEPFVGACNILPRLRLGPRGALCADLHAGVITLWRAVQRGWAAPTNITEADYARLRGTSRTQWTPEAAFVAFACSYAGKEWGGYARSGGRNYAADASAGMPAASTLADAVFGAMDYRRAFAAVQPGDVVYCDPPYQSTTGYRVGRFSSDEFWNACRRVRAAGVRVFVSEFTRPDFCEVRLAVDRVVTTGFGRPRRTDFLLELR